MYVLYACSLYENLNFFFHFFSVGSVSKSSKKSMKDRDQHKNRRTPSREEVNILE